MRVAVSLVVLCGCRQLYGLHDPDPASQSDGAVTVDTLESSSADGSTQLCVTRPDLSLLGCVPPPTLPLVVPTNYNFDTEQSSLCSTLYPDNCIVALTSLSIQAGAIVRVTGARPLVVLVRGGIQIDGTLDASSHIADHSQGPGAAAVQDGTIGCNTTNGVTQGGGGGGSFSTTGGHGGRGLLAQATGGVAGDGSPAIFHAGCYGGTNGSGTKTFGGGAIAIVSKASIAIGATGIVMANGAGGVGGDVSRGGFGGGAGGLIVLDAPTIMGDCRRSGVREWWWRRWRWWRVEHEWW
ncbi:MAG: hypothetical protein QM831_33695 [Kofleriaceae bacterium]